MLPRQPTYLRSLGAEAGSGLARLSGIESFARAVVSGVIPVLAFEALGTKQAVSLTFAAGGLFALAVTLSFGRLQLLLSRKWVMTLGLALLAASAALNAFDGPLFALGIGFRSAAASIFAVSLSLLVMDAVQRSQLTKVESNRMLYVGVAWLVGPTLGLWLVDGLGRGGALVLSALAAFLAIVLFFRLPVSGEVRSEAAFVKPIASIRRYFDQPYLRIAYAITLSRSMFWVALFVYGPIYVKEAGLPVWVTGVMLSSASVFLFLSPLFRRAAERAGTRVVIMTGFVGLSAGMLVLGLLGEAQPIGVLVWELSALSASAIDVLGNIPFMRTVKPRERVAMTAVFSTWREVSTLTTPLLASFVLLFAPFWVFYVVLAGLSVSTAIVVSYLPRRL